MDFLVSEGAIVDLSDVTGDYDVYTSEMVEERVEVKEGDILIIHTGYHHFGWDHETADDIRYMVKHPGPDREFVKWAISKKLRWIGVDCGSADHPMNTIIRDWIPRQAKQAEHVFQKIFGKSLAEFYDDDKYQMMHKEWWATYESYNGWKRWGVGMAQPRYPWPDYQHELGGARVYYVTKKYWDVSIKDYINQYLGADLNFDVPDDIVRANETMRLPENVKV